MKTGAVDFLTKPFRDQDMLDAVARAIARDRKRREEEGRIEALKAQFAKLSPRERQVMALVAAGKMNNQVATCFRPWPPRSGKMTSPASARCCAG